MKILRFIILLPLLMATTCIDEEIKYPNDRLNDVWVLGPWEISGESINGISDLTVNCCRILEFVPDEDSSDFRGKFTYREGARQIGQGFFIIDPNQETIVFQREDQSESVYQYELDSGNDSVIFTFSENGSDIVQRWDVVR
ncbi:hypothetical protein [Cognataquiflexum rubidum]|uniref:hypothetical protein n=1 Tax=Cognataquiflexum rubidum TaxID=2922273 RepID=UPI001F133F71|nr:hypothetical protein [Cognataquiflexum rubidum]MCH6236024.1 hypothetical protein [Cognataquiflexum rubidum]